jgi:hypothetical protein
MAPVPVTLHTRPPDEGDLPDVAALPVQAGYPALDPNGIEPIGDDWEKLFEISACSCSSKDDNPYN